MAFLIAENMGIDTGRIEFDITKPKGIFRKNTDNSRFVSLSGFQYTPFREGLKNTVQWYCRMCGQSPETIRTASKSGGKL